MTTKNRITGCLAAIASMAVVPQASAVLVLSVDLEGDPSNGGTAITEAGFVSLTALGGETVGATVSTMEAGVNATVGATGGGFLAGRTGIGNDRGGDLSNLTNNDLQGDLIAARGGDGTAVLPSSLLALASVKPSLLRHGTMMPTAETADSQPLETRSHPLSRLEEL